MIALAAIGNRAAGQTGFGTVVGALIMMLAVTIAHPTWLFPLFFFTLWLWRVSSPHAWYYAAEGTGSWADAFVRGLYIIPFGVVLTAVTAQPYHILTAIAAIFLVPAAYWLGFRFKAKPVECAELLAGLVIGVI